MMLYPRAEGFAQAVREGGAEATVTASDDLAVAVPHIMGMVPFPVRIFAEYEQDRAPGGRSGIKLRVEPR